MCLTLPEVGKILYTNTALFVCVYIYYYYILHASEQQNKKHLNVQIHNACMSENNLRERRTTYSRNSVMYFLLHLDHIQGFVL